MTWSTGSPGTKDAVCPSGPRDRGAPGPALAASQRSRLIARHTAWPRFRDRGIPPAWHGSAPGEWASDQAGFLEDARDFYPGVLPGRRVRPLAIYGCAPTGRLRCPAHVA